MNVKTLQPVQVGENETRYRKVIEGDPCEPGTQLYTYLQFEMIKLMSFDPAMTDCGPSHFKQMRMYHDGSKWVVEVEATVRS